MPMELTNDEIDAIEDAIERMRPLLDGKIPEEEKAMIEDLILHLEDRLDDPYKYEEEEEGPRKRKDEGEGPYKSGYHRKKKYEEEE